MTATINSTVSVGGLSLQESASITAENAIIQDVTVPAAKTGTLTTRTDNDTGVVTGEASHGITTGATVDVYWTGGARRGMTVGTVSGTSIPIDGGAGDNLPASSTALFITTRTSVNVPVSGDLIKLISLATAVRGTFVLATSGAEVLSKTLAANVVWNWFVGCGDANPAAGVTLATAKMSHGEIAAKTMRVVVLSSNS